MYRLWRRSREKVDIAIGNAIGSVTANTGIILAFSIMLAPFAIRAKTIRSKTFLLNFFAVLSLYIFSLTGKLTVIGCIVLAVIFAIFTYETLKSAKNEQSDERTVISSKRNKNQCYKIYRRLPGNNHRRASFG
ncbi:MAG: hypothetical protein L6V93_07925 [Clostridiales bacterium]|nr:MAG: hypothetical protein L6V93_07925 [Clostridiales bacterium]